MKKLPLQQVSLPQGSRWAGRAGVLRFWVGRAICAVVLGCWDRGIAFQGFTSLLGLMFTTLARLKFYCCIGGVWG